VRGLDVGGDGRRNRLVSSLNAVGSLDFMAARPTRLPLGLGDACSRRFVTEVKGLSPVVDVMSSKPSAAIEW